ncbi:MAG TPA: hypothetical protein VK438_08895 [Xanthobacteraceae bacterium]|nr:hypothetical protein [Xanthobacteraceae bacterium]
MRAGLKVAETSEADRDDRAAMGAALNRLYGAATESVREIVAALTGSERARLAVFCYGRTHLHATGLTIAASCSLEQLIAAAHSATAGRTIFAQSRDGLVPADKPLGRRAPISLAPSAAARAVNAVAESAQALA